MNQRRRREGGSAVCKCKRFLSCKWPKHPYFIRLFLSLTLSSVCVLSVPESSTVSVDSLTLFLQWYSYTLLFYFFALVVSFTLSPVCGNTKQNFLLIQYNRQRGNWIQAFTSLSTQSKEWVRGLGEKCAFSLALSHTHSAMFHGQRFLLFLHRESQLHPILSRWTLAPLSLPFSCLPSFLSRYVFVRGHRHSELPHTTCYLMDMSHLLSHVSSLCLLKTLPCQENH